jgi:trimethylamine--corrinoid protein Co-methyltransferase
MTSSRPPLEPLRTAQRLRCLSDEQLDRLQDATLRILEEVGVRFPSETALAILGDHGVRIDRTTQIARFPRDLVLRALRDAPRYFRLGAREPSYDVQLEEGATYFTTDGCGVETIDFDTRERRPSCKADVAKMARIADSLPSIGFYWPMVSAQDFGRTAPLHEMDASWNNTVKHVQSETVMGEAPCRYALEMATVIAGSREEIRHRPPFSLVVCTIAPLTQDKEGIEGALVLAEAGIPVGFLAMPTMGTTAPAAQAGALALADAEIISAIVLMQLAHPGAPVFHSEMHAWADPRSGTYISYPLDSRGRFAPVEMAHHWGLPSLGGAYGTDAEEPGTWQSAMEVAMDAFWVALTGAEFVTGIGLTNTYTLLYPEAILLDDDSYQRARYALLGMEVDEETLAVDVTAAVGPGGHFLAQKHTRKHMREVMRPALTHFPDAQGHYRDPGEVARERVASILADHHPEPLEAAKQAELQRILAAADREIG